MNRYSAAVIGKRACACGTSAIQWWYINDVRAALCGPCIKTTQQEAAAAMVAAPYPHIVECRRNTRNTFFSFDPVEGQRVNWTGKRHPFSGLSAEPDRFVRLTGREHTAWATDARAKELKIGPYAEERR